MTDNFISKRTRVKSANNKAKIYAMTEVGDNKEKQMKRAMSNAELIDELKGIKEISKKMSLVVNKLGYAGFPLKGIDVQLQ